MLGLALDAVFPPRCGGCRRRGCWFCQDCVETVRAAPLKACRRCRRLVSVDPCPMCEAGEGPESMIALARLEGSLRHAVHRFKYGDRPQLAAVLVAATLRPDRVAPGLLVPVPLEPGRRRRRGYNQSALLAFEISRATGWPWAQALRRVPGRGRQVGRGAEDRRQALQGAFRWVGGGEVPATIVLVDDVLTTGATLLEAGLVAQAAGVRRVESLALTLG